MLNFGIAVVQLGLPEKTVTQQWCSDVLILLLGYHGNGIDNIISVLMLHFSLCYFEDYLHNGECGTVIVSLTRTK